MMARLRRASNYVRLPNPSTVLIHPFTWSPTLISSGRYLCDRLQASSLQQWGRPCAPYVSSRADSPALGLLPVSQTPKPISASFLTCFLLLLCQATSACASVEGAACHHHHNRVSDHRGKGTPLLCGHLIQ